MKFAIILPAYNESLTIAKVITDFHAILPQAEIWVIDNNSKDGTGEIARAIFSESQIPGGVLSERQQGKSFAVRKAFRAIEADIYVMCDADSTYPASELPRMIEILHETGADMVVGDRLTKGHYMESTRRLFHRSGNNLVRFLINFLFKGDLFDIMSGYRVMRKSLVKHFPSLNSGFELETELSIFTLERRFGIIEHPVDYLSRPEGSFSKLSTYRDGFKVLKLILFLFKNYRPLKFFGTLAVVFFLLGLATGIPVVVEFSRTGLVYKIPSAILATGMMLLSGHFLSLGVMMDSIANYHHQLFEIEMNKYPEHDGTPE